MDHPEVRERTAWSHFDAHDLEIVIMMGVVYIGQKIAGQKRQIRRRKTLRHHKRRAALHKLDGFRDALFAATCFG